jgi:hypothetical protein
MRFTCIFWMEGVTALFLTVRAFLFVNGAACMASRLCHVYARVVVHSKLNAMRRNGAGGDDALTWRAYDARVLSVTR